MHRVELKNRYRVEFDTEYKGKVPNAPCGVENGYRFV